MTELFIKPESKCCKPPAAGRIMPAVSAMLIVAILLSLLFSYTFATLEYQFNWSAVWRYREKFISGWGVTVLISFFSLILSLLFGITAALFKRSGILTLKYLATAYIETIRGTPLLVQILIFFYVVADAFGLENRYAAGILSLSLFSGAYLAEIIRGALESVQSSQLETARAIGLTTSQTYRYVIIPQVTRQLLPPVAGQFASIIKDSSLLSIIAINELTLNAQEINAYTYSTLESYIPLAFGYLILTFPVSLAAKYLEEKFRYAS